VLQNPNNKKKSRSLFIKKNTTEQTNEEDDIGMVETGLVPKLKHG
jgi:hypothetical protein